MALSCSLPSSKLKNLMRDVGFNLVSVVFYLLTPKGVREDRGGTTVVSDLQQTFLASSVQKPTIRIWHYRKGNKLEMYLKSSKPHFNHYGPWFGDVQIGANASLLQIFHLAETSVKFTLLLRGLCQKVLFWQEFWIQHFRSKCRWAKRKVSRPG